MIYNEVLQGSGVIVEKVELDPKPLRERILTCRSNVAEGATRMILARCFAARSGIFGFLFMHGGGYTGSEGT